MSNQILISENKVSRHSYFTIFLHWLLVLTVIYEIITVSIKFKDSITFHIIGGGFLGLTWVVHLIYHYLIRKGSPIFPRKGDIKSSILMMKATFSGTNEPPNEKYLPEQRLAYLYILLCTLLVMITGLGRALGGGHKHEALQNMNFMQILGIFHGPAVFLLILGIVAHLGAFLIKANRPLLISMFNGKVHLEYVKQRHETWYAQLKKK